MHIPKFWAPARRRVSKPNGEGLNLQAWGWSDRDLDDARRMADTRLQNVLTRVLNGAALPRANSYGYGERPLREEIIDSYPGPQDLLACVTRNRYGSLVLNTSRMLFIDVDLPEPPPPAKAGLFGGLFGRKAPPADARAERRAALRAALERLGPASFALYDTAAGFRALALNRAYAPDSSEVSDIMRATGADLQFAALCKRQASFRARLTPKPWRMRQRLPPGDFPRTGAAHAAFANWLNDYERAAGGFATCRFVEQVGVGAPLPEFVPLIGLHDEATRARSTLPLA